MSSSAGPMVCVRGRGQCAAGARPRGATSLGAPVSRSGASSRRPSGSSSSPSSSVFSTTTTSSGACAAMARAEDQGRRGQRMKAKDKVGTRRPGARCLSASAGERDNCNAFCVPPPLHAHICFSPQTSLKRERRPQNHTSIPCPPRRSPRRGPAACPARAASRATRCGPAQGRASA